MVNAEIVLGARLTGGEHPDARYEADRSTPGEIVEQVISTLANDNGLLRCRLIVLYRRSIATVEAS